MTSLSEIPVHSQSQSGIGGSELEIRSFGRKGLLFAFVLQIFLFACASKKGTTRGIHEDHNVLEKSVVYNYFNQSEDSVVWYFGNLRLMRQDSVNLLGPNIYRHEYEGDSLKIYFKNALLFSYSFDERGVSAGTVYYPFDSCVAYWAQFRESELHGLVISMDKQSEVLEVMMYKKGKYQYHLHHWRHSNPRKKRLVLGSPFDNPVIVQ